MADEPVRSIWHEVQERQGATFEDFDGWLWTESFGDVGKEYEAIRKDVAMWDVYPLVKWDFRGADAVRAAQRISTNDILGLGVGRVRYGAFVDENGQMVDDGTVYRLAEDHLWVMTNAPGYEDWFGEVFAGMDVVVENRTTQMPLLSIQGPRSREVLQGLTQADLSSLGYFHLWPNRVALAGIDVWVLRTGFSGELGFELIPAPEDAVALWEAVQGAGVTPFGTAAVEIARIESGMIVAGVEYEKGTRSPFDLSMDRFVALDGQGEFLGKARLEQIAAAPPNRFKTLRVQVTQVPEYGATVTKGGEEIGTMTSATDSPLFGVIGLAVLDSNHAAEGTEVEVGLGEGTVPATVDVLSVYDPNKERPRS
jgi:aminomethyltransferase